MFYYCELYIIIVWDLLSADRRLSEGEAFGDFYDFSLVINARTKEALKLNDGKSGPLFRPPHQFQPPQIFLSSRALNGKRREETRTGKAVGSTAFSSPSPV